MKKIILFITVFVVTAAVLGVLEIMSVNVVLPWITRHGEECLVPDITGLDEGVAVNMLTKASLRYEIIGETGKKNNNTIHGNVTAQSPSPGKRVKKGKIVEMVISSGSPMVTLPEVKGLPVGEISGRLLEEKITLEIAAEIPSDKYPEGTIIASDPEPGAGLKEGEKVSVLVSSGPSVVTRLMTDLTGSEIGNIREELAGMGFNPVIEPMHLPRDWKSMRIVRQEPLPGTIIKPSDKILLYLEDDKS